MPIDVGLSRTFDSTGDKHELNGKEFFEQAHRGYLQCITDARFAKKSVVIDALGTKEEITQRILAQL